MRMGLAGVCLLATGTAARSELPPQYYDSARRLATSVIVVDISSVDRLGEGQTIGRCRITGRVAAVERGSLRVGQPVTISVPCVGAAWRPRRGPFAGYRDAMLASTRRGRFFLAGDTLVRRGFDPLAQ